MLSFKLPWPPSVNRYWRRGRGRTHLSDAGRQYREDGTAAILADTGLPDTIECDVAVIARLHPPDYRRRDTDNVLKPLLDLLEHVGVVRDDNQVVDVHALRRSVRAPGSVLLQVVPLGEVRASDHQLARHPLVVLQDLLGSLAGCDRILGSKADRSQKMTAQQAILGHLDVAQTVMDGWIASTAADRYSPLAD